MFDSDSESEISLSSDFYPLQNLEENSVVGMIGRLSGRKCLYLGLIAGEIGVTLTSLAIEGYISKHFFWVGIMISGIGMPISFLPIDGSDLSKTELIGLSVLGTAAIVTGFATNQKIPTSLIGFPPCVCAVPLIMKKFMVGDAHPLQEQVGIS